MNHKTELSDIMVDLIKVTKIYPPDVVALRDVSLTVRQGETLFLTGSSGAGKTSLLRLISRIEKPSKGLVEVAGMDVSRLPQKQIHTLRQRIGIVFQNFKLLPEKSVADNIAVPMEVAYRKRSFIHKRTKDLLDQLNLRKKINTMASELSRGEQQRVAIARAAANFPELILADEPTGNLDAGSTELVMDLFRKLNNQGTTFIIATHDKSIYQHNLTRIVELRFGQLYDNPPNDSTTDME